MSLNEELLEEVQCFKYLNKRWDVETTVRPRTKVVCESVMRCRTCGLYVEARMGLHEEVVVPTPRYEAGTVGGLGEMLE